MKDRHKKEKKSTRKHHRILWVFAFFLVVGIGVTAYILLFSAYTRWVGTGDNRHRHRAGRNLQFQEPAGSAFPDTGRSNGQLYTDVLPKLIMEPILSLDLTLQKHRFSERKTLPPSVLP